ncbi:hypothetical protein CK203_062316 [Vitis vinifera]|uniref:Reverse transcriptase/retrotransposon-derived protein RNase H-like domain-containing protein n=1 Tax=Vitis vinifera TaxID=29760 RepID=A0A438GT77_VITVI|nr:hypothetical protein CK203_062316 [Vitis vinifera]
MRIWSQYRQILGVHGYTKGHRAGFTYKLRPFFLTLKRASASRWTSDYELAFEEIKHYLTQPPILSNPQPGKEQRPVYYVSKAMVDGETRYSKMEQTTLALRSAPDNKGQVMVGFIAETPQKLQQFLSSLE